MSSGSAILERPQTVFFLSDGFGFEPKVYAGSGGNKVFSGVAVFRSGTFRDSTGVQNTWEPMHMRQMVDNWDHLTSKHILSSVPARDGHPGWLINNMPGKGEVVGWHHSLKVETKKSPVDGLEYDYLMADYEITQQYALDKIQNGTWRNRSAEIGGYTTNNEAEFWPVYLGFAFVDFSAVEGLNFSASTNVPGRFFSYIGGTHSTGQSRENQMTQPASGGTQAGGLELPFTPPAAPAQGTASPAATQHSGQGGQAQPFVFSVNGMNESDPNKVQAYIRQLEGFVTETKSAARSAFVAGLLTSNKITAPQKDGMEAFAKSLSDEQYTAWCAGWEIAAPAPILQQHGGTGSQPSAANVTTDEQAIADAEEMVKMHQRAGMPKADLQKTASYQKLVKAGKVPA